MTLGPDAHPYLWQVLETNTVVRHPKYALMPLWIGKIALVCIMMSYTTTVFCCSKFLIVEENTMEMIHVKIRSFVLATAVGQYGITHLRMFLDRKTVENLLRESNNVYKTVINDPGNHEILEEADKESRIYVKTTGIVLFLSAILIWLQSLLKIMYDGELHYSFDISPLGFPPAVEWVVNSLIPMPTAQSIWCYYSFLNCYVRQLTAYSKCLARMIRERPKKADKEYDREIVELQQKILRCDFSRSSLSKDEFKKSNGENVLSTLAELIASMGLPYALCSSGQALEDQRNIIYKGVLESKWYEYSPHDRKMLISILQLTEDKNWKLHFKHAVTFNNETLGSIIQSIFSLMTVLANFIGDN